MPDQQLPPCGIGGQSVSGGPCSGTYTPNQAGQDAFSTVSTTSITSALLAAGAILAGLIFVTLMVRKVAGFFGGAPAVADPYGPGSMYADDQFWAARGREANASRPDAEFSDFSDDEAARELDYELDEESQAEADSQSERGDWRLGYEPGEPDLEDRPGAELSDEDYDRLEWREEWRRENGGV